MFKTNKYSLLVYLFGIGDVDGGLVGQSSKIAKASLNQAITHAVVSNVAGQAARFATGQTKRFDLGLLIFYSLMNESFFFALFPQNSRKNTQVNLLALRFFLEFRENIAKKLTSLHNAIKCQQTL